jgi:hypothetical protein
MHDAIAELAAIRATLVGRADDETIHHLTAAIDGLRARNTGGAALSGQPSDPAASGGDTGGESVRTVYPSGRRYRVVDGVFIPIESDGISRDNAQI